MPGLFSGNENATTARIHALRSLKEDLNNATTQLTGNIQTDAERLVEKYGLRPVRLRSDKKPSYEPPCDGTPGEHRLKYELVPDGSNQTVLHLRPNGSYVDRYPLLADRGTFDPQRNVIVLRGTPEDLEVLRDSLLDRLDCVNEEVQHAFRDFRDEVIQTLENHLREKAAAQQEHEETARRLGADYNSD